MPNPQSDLSSSAHFVALLQQAASLWGLEPEFWDIWGQRHVPEPKTIRAILRSLGVNCDAPDQLARAIEEKTLLEWKRPVPPTLVITSGQIPIRVVRHLRSATANVDLRTEDGTESSRAVPLAQCAEGEQGAAGGQEFVELLLCWPEPIPLGYHSLRVTVGDSTAECQLISAPERAWIPQKLEARGRLAGVAVSLYGVRSERNWGCGDLTDLQGLLHWLKEDLHASFLALNPLHAIDNRQPYNISPYLPNSAYFRNALYIDIEAVPEYARSASARRLVQSQQFQSKLRSLREAPFVEYEQVWSTKRFLLGLLYREFLRSESARKREFEAYVAAQGERLERFALYCALWDWLHRRDRNLWIWPEWPMEYQKPDTPEVAAFQKLHRRRIEYYKYVQWILDQQLEAVQSHAGELGLPVGLYHDLALATDKCGADVWGYREFYVTGCRVGSPPDGFAPEGQDWAFPPPNAITHRDNGYRLFIDSIRANSRHGGALRIDHVMRLFRLFWIPDGVEAKNGAYVRDFHRDLLGILALESHRGQFFIVGEDLGTVTDLVRQSLDQYGVLSYKVLFFEKHPDGRFRHPGDYARQALVSSTTHDLATLAGFWVGRDIEARMAAGLLPNPESYRRQWDERTQDKQRLLDVLHELRLLPEWFPRDAGVIPQLTGELHSAVIGFLTQTPSMVMVLNQEDLTKEMDQQNLPASTHQYPNWRRKMKYTVEELRQLKAPQDFAAMFRHWLARSGRAL